MELLFLHRDNPDILEPCARNYVRSALTDQESLSIRGYCEVNLLSWLVHIKATNQNEVAYSFDLGRSAVIHLTTPPASTQDAVAVWSVLDFNRHNYDPC